MLLKSLSYTCVYVHDARARQHRAHTAKNLGLEQLGTRGEPARDRSTGSGYVAKRDGAYADALAKQGL